MAVVIKKQGLQQSRPLNIQQYKIWRPKLFEPWTRSVTSTRTSSIQTSANIIKQSTNVTYGCHSSTRMYLVCIMNSKYQYSIIKSESKVVTKEYVWLSSSALIWHTMSDSLRQWVLCNVEFNHKYLCDCNNPNWVLKPRKRRPYLSAHGNRRPGSA